MPPEGDPHKAAPSDGITSRPARHPPRHPAARQGRPAPVRPDRGDRLRPRGRRPNRGTRGRIPDGGSTWVHADLDEPENPWTWQHWHAALIMPPGGAQLIARAWDDTAAVPPESPATVWNPRGYANNSWARPHVIVRP
ncbi:hypothetical protein ACFOSC_26200 [Streptantibioticus rubrisoli]|uniref:hypothetical protein n=1 Tax=Streptantibioticus rubrisoli TaxID=1387313 RepID=UPI003558D720